MIVTKTREKKHHRAEFKIEKGLRGPILNIGFSKSIRNALKRLMVDNKELSDEVYGIKFYHFKIEHSGKFGFVAFEKKLIDTGKTILRTFDRSSVFWVMRDVKFMLRNALNNGKRIRC